VSSAERKPWSATAVETVLNNPYFSVRTQDVTVTDGSSCVYHTIHFPNPAVGIVARRGTDFLLIRQYRFIVDEFVWAIPSGSASTGESLESCAIRELEEETGYTARHLKPLLFCYASYGSTDQRFEIFQATDVRKTASVPDANEVIEARWFTRDEVIALIDENGIVDNLSLSPLLLALRRD
jgi:ADP-ribose pyrophosphatase